MKRPYTLEVRHEAARLRRRGLSQQEIAERLGVARKTVQRWFNPALAERDREASRAAKQKRTGTCVDCGGTTRYNGVDVSDRCVPCHVRRVEAQHGTHSRYNGGCSCDACRQANRDHMRSLRGQEPPTHSASGYTNYGCRCDVCKEAILVYNRSKGYEAQRRWYEKHRRAAA